MTSESLHYDFETTDITVNQEGSEYLWLQNGTQNIQVEWYPKKISLILNCSFSDKAPPAKN